MADGESHLRWLNYGWAIIIPTGIVIFGIAAWLSLPYSLLYPLFTYLNYYLCRFQDPDDDLPGASSSEGRLQRATKKVNVIVGFFGSIINGYKSPYAYLVNVISGGHRTWLSHGWVIGALFRIFYYNLPLVYFLYSLFGYGASNWGWKDFKFDLYLDVWLAPYFSTQVITWVFADSIHIVLDMKWAEGVLWQRKSVKKK